MKKLISTFLKGNKYNQRIINEAKVVNELEEENEAKSIEIGPLSEEEHKFRYGFNRAIELGLFCPTWYKARYGEFDNDFDAFKDFCFKSTFSNVTPSSNFDTETYQRHHLDTYLQSESPLLHYVFHGLKEGRRKHPTHFKWQPTSLISAKGDNDWNTQKIAICLHVFYADFIDKFAVGLRSFPCAVDVYVTASEDIAIGDIESAFSDIPNVNQLTIATAPNRGRNFGPMLVEFSEQLLDYDLICHLHSKKSLYSGREQTQWFDYLNQFLFNDNHIVSSVLKLFNENEKLGMYYPTTFHMMPSWVNHWTCNKRFAEGFCNDWGIEIADDFVSYPVGGMFWARPKALKQLLQTSYSYEDFPEEPLPNDGSWLHALERIIGLLVEKNNYQQFHFYPPSASFTLDQSYKYIGYSKPVEHLKRELGGHDIVSFDIFDTLLRREYTEPDYAKYLLGKHLSNEQLVSSADAFVTMRNSAEMALRQQRGYIGDVSIIDIYDYLGEQLGWEHEECSTYRELEFQFDLEMVLPKDEMVSVLTHFADTGSEIWLVSDTYYTEKQIELMLQRIGVGGGYKLFVSSALKKRKDTGTMWSHISKLVKESERSFVHVGDNVRSDAQLCGDYGLKNLHILNPVDKWTSSGMSLPKMKRNDMMAEETILKWGRLIANHGRYPFHGG